MQDRKDLTGDVLSLIAVAALFGTAFLVLRPFAAATIWAVMVVVATWPVLLALEKRLGSRHRATALLLLALALLFVLPLTLALSALVELAPGLNQHIRAFVTHGPGAAPPWLSALPLAGPLLAERWNALADNDIATLWPTVQPYAGRSAQWLYTQVGALAGVLLHLLLTLLICALFYLRGEIAAQGLRRFAQRLAGTRALSAVTLGTQAIRGVALGVVVTALAQSLLGGIGLAICAIPYAALLTVLMFFLCIAQLGPTLVLAPAVIYLFWSGATLSASALLIVALIATFMDTFLRPWLINKGADLPLLLIFAGVIGGLVGFGLIGIFIGPLVLAVAYKWLQAWVQETRS